MIESFMGKLSLSWTSWESLHGLWEAAKTNIDFRSLGEVLQDLALDEARHAVVPSLLRRLDHQSQQQQWHKPAMNCAGAAPSDNSISRLPSSSLMQEIPGPRDTDLVSPT